MNALLLLLLPLAQDVSLEPVTFQAGDIVYQAERGRLRVPENRSAEDSRTLTLAFVRLRSTAEEPGPPLFYLPGGPGNAAVPGAELPIWPPFLELGDVVLLDPRGVGESEPDLVWSSDEILPELFFTDRETAVGHMAELLEQAGDELRAAGVDFRGYTAEEKAEDLEALCAGLGYERVNLMAHSWGTVVGQVLIRRHPDRVARFVSVGTAGPDELMKLPSQLDRSVRHLAQVVAADPVIGEEMPDLLAAIDRAAAGLEEEPLFVTIRDPRGGEEPLEVPVGAFGFRLLLVADLADASDLPVIPRLVDSVEKRNPALVRYFLQKRVAQFSRLPLLMLCARAASGASVERWATIRSEARESPFGLARCLFSPESDAGFGDIDVGDANRARVEGDLPVLFVSGTLDASTPVEQTEGVRRGFPHSGHVIVENAGHEDLLPDPEVRALAVAFLAGDEPEDVVLERPPLRFAPLTGPAPGIDHDALR